MKTLDELKSDVIEWAIERNLDTADPHKQMLKVTEEAGEAAGALAKSKHKDLEMEIGDLLVTLIILTRQLDMDITSCLEAAHNKNANRKGETINGIYIKKEDLTKDIQECKNCNKEINTEHDTFITMNVEGVIEEYVCYECI